MNRLSLALVAVLSLGFVTEAEAQRTTFNPQLALEQGWSDNIEVVDEESSSDSNTRLSALLPVVREWSTGSFGFSYEPSIQRYADFDDLNDDRHRVELDLQTTPSRRDTFGLTASYTKTQEQGTAQGIDSVDAFLSPRTDRELIRLESDYFHEINAKWNVRGAIDGADFQFETIDELGLPAPTDRVEWGGAVEIGRTLSPKTSLGFGYGWRRFDLDTTGEETAQSAFLSVHYRASRVLSLDAAVGGFHSEGDAIENVSSDDSRSGVQFTFGMTRDFKASQLTVDAEHRPSAGGALDGTSTDSAIGVNYTGTTGRAWFWNASTRLARRDPTTDGAADLDTLAVSGSIERGFARTLGVRLGASWADQSSDDPAQESKITSGTIGLVWYPLGRTELARGGRS